MRLCVCTVCESYSAAVELSFTLAPAAHPAHTGPPAAQATL